VRLDRQKLAALDLLAAEYPSVAELREQNIALAARITEAETALRPIAASGDDVLLMVRTPTGSFQRRHVPNLALRYFEAHGLAVKS
jgi:hypothetical protein